MMARVGGKDGADGRSERLLKRRYSVPIEMDSCKDIRVDGRVDDFVSFGDTR
jgi:hypothetical protein